MTNDKEQVFRGIHCGPQADPLYLQKNFVGIGWHDVGDLAKLGPTRQAFKKAVTETYPTRTVGAVINSGKRAFGPSHETKVGHVVIYRSKVGTQNSHWK